MEKKIFPFRYKLSLLMFMVVSLSVSFLGVNQYLSMQQMLQSHFEQNKDLVTDRIMNSVNDADYMILTVEKQLEQQAREILLAVNDRYEREGTIDFDLESFLSETTDVHLYVIDQENRVVKSTDQNDLGLDFNEYPDFVSRLETIREEKNFFTDRISLSLVNSEMKKYCYLASADGRYIFETGSLMSRENNVLLGAGFDNFEQPIVNDNQSFVEEITLYDYTGISYKKDNMGNPYSVKEANRKYYEQALETMEPVEMITEEGDRNLYYQYIPYTITAFQGMNDVNVIEIVYHDKVLKSSLEDSLRSTILLMFLCGILSATLGFYFAEKIAKPISQLTEASNKMAAGDFNVNLHFRSHDELDVLGKKFQNMVYNIKELMEERYEHERILEDKNGEILNQKEEITVLYEETAAMNEELEYLLDENKKNYFETVWALANSMEVKDAYTGGHCERVMEYAMAIGEELELNSYEMNDLKFGSILHDIGKIGIPEEVLNKKGHFTDSDYALMKKHPELGGRILNEVHFLERSRKIVMQHHERVDGKGYPQGLKGEEIDLLARIVCVADAYDAMTSSRSYREHVLNQKEAIEELVANKGTQFDEKIIQVFVAYLQRQGTILS